MSPDNRKMNEFLRLARAGAPVVEKKKVTVAKKPGDDLAAIRAASATAVPTTPASSTGAPATQPPPRLPDKDKPSPDDHPEQTPSVEPGPVAEPGAEPPAKPEGEGNFTPAEQAIRDAAQALSAAKAQQDDKAIAKARTALVEALRAVGGGAGSGASGASG